MDANTAELTTVIEHDASGRIKKFIKHYVPLECVPGLKAVAQLRAEEDKAGELAKSVDHFLEKLHEPRENKEHQALIEKARKPSALPAPAPISAPAPQPSPSPAVAGGLSHREPIELPDFVRLLADMRKDQARDEAKNAAWQKRYEAKRKEIDEILAAREAAQAEVNADYVGRMIGKAMMLRLIECTPSGGRVTNADEYLNWSMTDVLKQLREQHYQCSEHPDFEARFVEAWWLGCNEAIEQFNQEHAETKA
jgi:hypothetical protein